MTPRRRIQCSEAQPLRGEQMMYRNLTLLALVASIAASTPVLAQRAAPYTAPRTENGQPDFQGVWVTAFLTPLERPADVDYLVASPEQEKALVRMLRERI